MRYAPDVDLAFIHIPKNGGQSVRNALEDATPLSYAPLAQDLSVSEEEARTASEAGFEHPILGSIHPAHLPLPTMRDHFPACWEAFQSAKSFALIREPRDRFISALMQRMREFGDDEVIRSDDPRVAAEAQRVAEMLTNDGRETLPLEFVHFNRQAKFTDLDGQRMLSRIFPVDETSRLTSWLVDTVGLSISIGHDHARRQPKRWAKKIVPIARFIGRNLMPIGLKRAVYGAWTNSAVFSDAASSYQSLDLGSDVDAFILEYYSYDFSLYDEAKTNADNIKL